MATAAKLIALYRQPENAEAFEQRYWNEHVPLAEKIPGLRRMEVTKFDKNLMGGETPYYMMAELVFDSAEDLKAGMASEEGKAAGANIMSFAGPILTMVTSHVESRESAAVPR